MFEIRKFYTFFSRENPQMLSEKIENFRFFQEKLRKKCFTFFKMFKTKIFDFFFREKTLFKLFLKKSKISVFPCKN